MLFLRDACTQHVDGVLAELAHHTRAYEACTHAHTLHVSRTNIANVAYHQPYTFRCHGPTWMSLDIDTSGSGYGSGSAGTELCMRTILEDGRCLKTMMWYSDTRCVRHASP